MCDYEFSQRVYSLVEIMVSASNLCACYAWFWTCLLAVGVHCSDQLVYTFSNRVGSGNFSYFKLHRDGYVRLTLRSVTGDADLYVSSKTLSPDYFNYELSSTTCGDDEVIVTADVLRPVGVGVFGHPSHDVSDFNLAVYIDDNTISPSHSSLPNLQHPSLDSANEESLIWSIFVGVLKVILDILM